MTGAHQTICGLLAAAMMLIASPVLAEPVDLTNPTPRWIDVQFETSPVHLPGQHRVVWTPPMPARFRPASREGWVVVAIPPDVVEHVLLADQDPIPGSFGPFVWVFDAATGHVLAADLEGAVERRLGLGVLGSKVRTDIRVEMGTDRAAGFRPLRRVLGVSVHDFCDVAEPGACTLVPPIAYDRKTGYVNAVGLVDARALSFRRRSFSSLGEARFRERSAQRLVAGSAGPAHPASAASSGIADR